MRNIHYYIKKFGRFDTSEFPFNEVDALILSELAYADFSEFVGGITTPRPDVTLSDIAINKSIKRMVRYTMSPHSNGQMIKLMRKSKRFKDMRLNYYRNKVDTKLELQFSAIVFTLKDSTFVAFRGTDTTLTGWKEDFNMVFLDVIPSQEQCLIYLNEIANKIEGNFYIGGHSKGGNLATFASIYTNPEIQKRIIKIYDFEGPGFKYDIFNSEKFQNIADKLQKYITRDSMIGVVMYNFSKYEIVRSSGIILMQHDPFRWRVTKNGRLDVTENTTFNCKVFERTVKEWLVRYPEEERVKILEIFYKIISACKTNNLLDFKTRALKFIHSMRKQYKQIDGETLEYFKRTLHEYWDLYFSIRKEMKAELKQIKKH